MKDRVHIDITYIISIIFKDDFYQLSMDLLSRLTRKGNNFELVLLQANFGEIISVILKKHKKEKAKYGIKGDHNLEDNLKKLSNIIIKYNIDAEHCIIPPSECVFEMAHRIESDDKAHSYADYGYIDRTDLFYASSAIADPNSKFLFTEDKVLLRSEILKKYCKKDVELCDGKTRNTDLRIKSAVSWMGKD
jgi:hypothetical protein